MKLIVGGAFQGKLEYAKKTYGIEAGWLDGEQCSWEDLFTCNGIHGFHMLLLRMIKEEDLISLEQRAEEMADQLYEKNPSIVIITNELGYGVVPMEKQDRIWRELTGRVCTRLAQHADELVRVVCGTGMKLK